MNIQVAQASGDARGIRHIADLDRQVAGLGNPVGVFQAGQIQVKRDLRVAARKAQEDLRHHVGRECCRHIDAQQAGRLGGQRLQFLVRDLRLFHDTQAALQIHLACPGQLHLAGAAVKQAQANRTLQLRHATRQRRFRQPQHDGGAAEAARLGHLCEQLHAVQASHGRLIRHHSLTVGPARNATGKPHCRKRLLRIS
ncbi:hypothetical protein G6F68_014439 [Rhizopus microsporus]|nr:hypothetical protein G6F68_014439 [Rhizopus microsporus]